MNEVQNPSILPPQDVASAGEDLRSFRKPYDSLSCVEEFIHELRQPRVVIENLAYFLEITCSDERTCAHLQQIQAMVLRAHTILEDHEKPNRAFAAAG